MKIGKGVKIDGLARKNEGCRALEMGANQTLVDVVREMTVSGMESWGCGGLHLPLNVPQGGRDSVCSQKSQNPGAGRVLANCGPLSSFACGNTEAQGVSGRGVSTG